MYQAECIEMGRESAFNAAAYGIRKSSDGFFVRLAETGTKRWPTLSELEMPKLPRFTVQEGIKRLREIGMLEWVYHLRLIHPHWESQKIYFFLIF